MKRVLIAGTAALTVLLSTEAFTQGVVLEVAPEQRTRIKEYVVRERVPRATIREEIAVGGVVPADVELREAPSEWGPSYSKYRYYHTDRGVRFVDPGTRRVIYDLD
jgi:uncharacterized protein DUF1236